jgi:hypothetical protein
MSKAFGFKIKNVILSSQTNYNFKSQMFYLTNLSLFNKFFRKKKFTKTINIYCGERASYL